ncbi:LysR family transcriptional regulator, partial [Rhizobium johnstonii]|uniref:LysR family transcriptional regulator n=1 Tax=Rhizobium johnstonii TaxID=3019933 RepID=UPI003F9BA698
MSVAGVASNLASVDLNLLVALDALLQHRNVTRAGKRVGLSQPAMSRALSRLRALFDDEPLVRTPRGPALKWRAKQLRSR